MAHRYYTKEIGNGRACITGPDAVHLVRVLRVKPGERLVLCDGENTDYDAVVESAGPEQVLLRVDEGRRSAAEPSLWAEVYIGYSKGDRLEYAIQKCVELGASYIQPFFSANCVVKPKKEEEKNKRYNRIAAEAAKQCGRGILPRVGMPLGYREMLAHATRQGQRALFLYECGGERLQSVIQNVDKIAVITGCEGGFTPAEAAEAAEAGCVTVGLGPRILRCETAPVAVLAAAMAFTGNLE